MEKIQARKILIRSRFFKRLKISEQTIHISSLIQWVSKKIEFLEHAMKAMKI